MGIGHLPPAESQNESWRDRSYGWDKSVPEETVVSTGTVKWFNEKKGFGFITQDEGGDDLFQHHSKIDMQGFRTLKEGQRVAFDVTNGEKGKIAINVRPA